MSKVRRPACAFIIATLTLFISLPIIAYADLVSGKVTPVPSSRSFSIKDTHGNIVKNSVTTDAGGNFQVTLMPGVYSANSDKGTATIQSSNRPLVGQIVNFKE